jgi:hypothetical protein
MYPLFEGDDDDDDGGGKGDDGGGSSSGGGVVESGEMVSSQSKNNVGAISKSGPSEIRRDRSEPRSIQNNKNTSGVAKKDCEATTNSKMQGERSSTQAGVDSERDCTQVLGTCQESRRNQKQEKNNASSSQDTNSHSSVAPGMQKADNKSSSVLKRKKGSDDAVSESQLKSMKHSDQVRLLLSLFSFFFLIFFPFFFFLHNFVFYDQ